MIDVELLNSLVGIPWQEDGRSYEGTDCVGLMELYYRGSGIETETPKMSEARNIEPEKLAERIKEGAEIIKANKLKEGDVLVFQIKDELHVGLFLGFGKMLHAKEGDRSRISRLTFGWCKHFVFALRPKNGKIYLPPAGPPVAVAIVGAVIGGTVAAITGATLFGSAMLGLAWGVIGGAMMGYSIGLAMNPPRFAQDATSPRYRFGKLANTSSNQLPLPRIYGKVRYAGNIVRETIWGAEKRGREWLIILSEGEVQSITDVRVNGRPIHDFPGCTYFAFLGTSPPPFPEVGAFFYGGNPDGVQYRNRACMVVRLWASEKLPGGRPTVTCVVEGLKVPIWNGVHWSTIAYSANPAACIRDYMLTPKQRGGCGHRPEDLDDASFAEVYDHSKVLVPDGAGGTEERFQIGFVLDQKKPAIDYISEMMIGFGGMLFRSGEKFKLRVAKEEVAVLSLNEDDHISKLEVHQKGLDEKINRFGIEYFDPDQNDVRILVWGAEDKADQKRRGLVEKTLTIAAIDRRSQALRLSNQYFYELKLNSLMIEMHVGLDAIALEPGDVTKITHSLMGWTDKLFRVVEIEEDELDIYRIRAQEYNPTIYNDRYGASIQIFNYGIPPNPWAPVSEVSNIILADSIYLKGDGTVATRITATWNAPIDDTVQFLSHYEVEYRTPGQAYTRAGTAGTEREFIILDVIDGSQYQVRIKTVSINDIISDGVESGFRLVAGKTVPPANVGGFSVIRDGNDIIFNWSPNADLDLFGYEIREGISWERGTIIETDIIETTFRIPVFVFGDRIYRIKAVDTTGNYSLNDVSQSFEITNTIDMEFLRDDALDIWHEGTFDADSTLSQLVVNNSLAQITNEAGININQSPLYSLTKKSYLLSDNFDDGTIDATLWTQFLDGVGSSQSESGGVLIQENLSGNVGIIMLQRVGTFIGDMEVDVDVDWINVPNVPGQDIDAKSSLQIRMIDGHFFSIDYIASDGIITCRYHDGTVAHGVGWVFSNLLSCKLRIRRIGSTIEGFFWDGATWQLVGTKIGGSTANYKTTIRSDGRLWTVHYDNFTLGRIGAASSLELRQWTTGLYTERGSYISKIIDLGWKLRARIFIAIATVGANKTYEISIQTSDDNIAWSPWRLFKTGEYECRYFRIKATVITFDTALPASLHGLHSHKTVWYIVDGGEDINVVQSKAISFDKTFFVKVSIYAIAQGPAYVRVLNKSLTGFTANTYDETGAPTTALVDWHAKGY